MNPSFELEQKLSKVVIVKVVSLLGLGIIFYIGILLIISLINLPAVQETYINVGALVLLILIISIGSFLDYKRGKMKYLFFTDKITFGKKEIFYRDIVSTEPKVSLIDKMFKTYSIKLNDKFILRNVSNEIDMKTYLDQLVEYSRR